MSNGAALPPTSGRELASIPTAQGALSRLAIARIRSAGLPVEPLLRRAGLTAELIDAPEERLSVRSQIALLDAAAQLDAEPTCRINARRPAIATLVLAGPRAHELCLLRWRDVDLPNGRISIVRSKTEAGIREVQLLPLLRDELAAHRARSQPTGPDDLVFPMSNGRERDD